MAKKEWLIHKAYPGDTQRALFDNREVKAPPKFILVQAAIRDTDKWSHKVALRTSQVSRPRPDTASQGIDAQPETAIELPAELLDALCDCDSISAPEGSVPVRYQQAGLVARRYYRPGVPGRFWIASAAGAITVATAISTTDTTLPHRRRWPQYTSVFGGLQRCSLSFAWVPLLASAASYGHRGDYGRPTVSTLVPNPDRLRRSFSLAQLRRR